MSRGLLVEAPPDVVEMEVVIDNFKNFAKKTRDELIRPDVAETALDVRFSDEHGSIIKRGSRAKYGGMATLGTSKVLFAVRYYKSSTSAKKLIIAYGTTLKVGDDSDGVFTNIKTGLTANQQWTSVTFKNLLYLTNGIDAAQVFDAAQTATETLGVPVPTPAPTAVETGTGVLTGAYKYKVSYELDGYQEGNASAASGAANPTGAQVQLTAIPTSPNTRATARYLYRTLAGGSIYYRLIKLSNNTATAYLDNIADGSLDQTLTAPTDYGGPDQNYRFLALHKDRLFLVRGATDKSKVIYSDLRSGVAYPDVFPANNSFYIRRDDGDEITAVIEDQNGQLIFFKANALVRVSTDADSPVSWSGMNNVLSRDGCLSAYSPARTHRGILYVSAFAEGKRRLLLWDGSQIHHLFDELDPVLSLTSRRFNDDFMGVYHDGIYELAFNDLTQATCEAFNNRVLRLDLIHDSWTMDRKNVQCWSVWSRRTDMGELYSGTADATGLLLREDTALEDILIQTQTDLKAGLTFSQCEATGTEAAQKLTFIQAQLTDDIGAQVISTATGVSSIYTGDLDTIGPSCRYESEIFDADPVQLLELLWNEVLGTNGEVLFWIRTGNCTADVLAASWSGPYTTPTGSDISAVTLGKKVQIACKMYVKAADTAVSEAPNIYLERGSAPSDYVVKVALGYGTLYETTIPMEYESNWLDLGWIAPQLKNRRKHWKTMKVEFNRSVATGSLTLSYRWDGSSTVADTKTWQFSDVAAQGYARYQFPMKDSCYKRIKYKVTHNDDLAACDITRVTFLVSPESYNAIF